MIVLYWFLEVVRLIAVMDDYPIHCLGVVCIFNVLIEIPRSLFIGKVDPSSWCHGWMSFSIAGEFYFLVATVPDWEFSFNYTWRQMEWCWNWQDNQIFISKSNIKSIFIRYRHRQHRITYSKGRSRVYY